MIAILLPLLAGVYFGYRYHVRRQRLDPLEDDQESSEPLNGMAERKAPPARTPDLPWWNWRRWTTEEETRYFPLADRSLPGRQRTD